MLPEVSRKRDGLPECGAVVVRQGVSDEHPGAEARSVAEIEVNGPRSVFFVPVCVRAAAHLPLGTLFLRPGGGRIFPSEHFFCDPAAVPSAPLNSPSRPYPAPLNTLAPPPPAPQNPRLFCPRPAPGPTAERAGPAPAPPQNPLHCPRPAPLNTLALSRLGPRKPPPKGRITPPKALFGAICRKVAPGVGYFVEYFVPLDAKNVFCSQ